MDPVERRPEHPRPQASPDGPTARRSRAGALCWAILLGGIGGSALAEAGPGPQPAPAETVRLVGGGRVSARRVTLVGGVFVLELDTGGGTGTLRLPPERVEPGDRTRLLAARTPETDASGQLRVARAAFEARLYAQAAERVSRAVALDPALEPEGRALFDRVRARVADEVLAEVELDLRLGRPLAARERARLLLEAGLPVEAPAVQQARARLLLALAERALPASAAGAAASPALPVAPPAPPAPPPGALPAAWADALRLVEEASRARERAGEPGLPPPEREALLLAAAEGLLHARRAFQALAPAGAPAELTARLDALRAALVATWLDLADLARGAGAAGVALDRVQAALVLDPDSERAWQLRGWIERDLTTSLLPLSLPLVFEGPWGTPFARPHAGRGYGPGCVCGPVRGGVRAGPGSTGSSKAGGGHHVAGTRR